MIERPEYAEHLSQVMGRSPVTALLGPRQCGKTTLVRMVSTDINSTYFDLESRVDVNRLQNPELMLGGQRGLVILDEIQALPELFQVIKVLVDRPENRARFLVLGSASPAIVKHVSETLAGRVEFVEISGFHLNEVGQDAWEDLWLRGGFPRSFLAASAEESRAWREGFIKTFLERDIPQLGITIPSAAMRRFWTMLAHYHGQTWNGSELGRSMGLSDKTMRSYLDILTGTYMVRQLQPWFENIKKRQVKVPKIYLRDTGLLHQLLDLDSVTALMGHPKVGASWEGFALEQFLQIARPAEAFFWATHGGAELDLFFLHRGGRYGVEVKYSEAPTVTKSMRVALEDLGLDKLWVIYPGGHMYPMDDRITACPLGKVRQLPELIKN